MEYVIKGKVQTVSQPLMIALETLKTNKKKIARVSRNEKFLFRDGRKTKHSTIAISIYGVILRISARKKPFKRRIFDGWSWVTCQAN